MEELPGKTEAEELGYILHHYAGNKNSATYIKGGISLTVFNNGTAKLETVNGLILCTTQEISFPHPRFEMWEKQIYRFVE